mmetsp:Transcript_9099/g.23029  ORF Transcript_9099/g.23029 Transcript_9099/m.23029 type:complete len:208 (-) Transcript_9099:2819-3442(-)
MLSVWGHTLARDVHPQEVMAAHLLAFVRVVLHLHIRELKRQSDGAADLARPCQASRHTHELLFRSSLRGDINPAQQLSLDTHVLELLGGHGRDLHQALHGVPVGVHRSILQRILLAFYRRGVLVGLAFSIQKLCIYAEGAALNIAQDAFHCGCCQSRSRDGDCVLRVPDDVQSFADAVVFTSDRYIIPFFKTRCGLGRDRSEHHCKH